MAPRAPPSLALEDVPLPQFIVALLLVKSKPTCLSTKGPEYLTALRSCIRQGERRSDGPTPQAHIDTAAFWRDAYTKSEESQIALRARIASLESRQSQRDTVEVHSQAVQPLQSQRKRKGEEPQVGSRKLPGRLVKQVRAANISSPRQAKIVQAQHQVSSANGSAVDDSVNAFLHHVYILQQLTSEFKASPQAVDEHLDQICMTLRRLVSFINVTKLHGPATMNSFNYSERLNHDIEGHHEPHHSMSLMVLNSIKNVLPTLFDCLNLVVEVKQRLSDHAIHLVIALFQDILERVCQLAMGKTAKNLRPTIGMQPVGQGQANWTLSHAQRDVPTSSGILSALSELAALLLGSCDTSKAAHSDILEGCMFLLMEKIGLGLKRFSIEKLTESGNQASAYGQYTRQSQGDSELQAQAPYLIYIFEQAQTLMAKQIQVPKFNDKPLDKSGLVVLRTRSANISGIAREKLQNTLLNAVFDEIPGKPLQPSLSRVMKSQALPDLELNGKAVEDWYKHELWRLLGWDILRSHLGLE